MSIFYNNLFINKTLHPLQSWYALNLNCFNCALWPVPITSFPSVNSYNLQYQLQILDQHRIEAEYTSIRVISYSYN